MQAASDLVETDEINSRARASLKDLLAAFARWRNQLDTLPHTELGEIILEESGYTEMWQADRSADAPGRLENLKELIRSMQEFESMSGFLEHIALVMDSDADGAEEAVSIMTLHSAKGLEFETVILPGWEEGLFPHQRSLDENGRAGLEEERRLAYVGITRAKKRAIIRFASNRRMHGLWQSGIPSRFLDELPEAHVDVAEDSSTYGGYGMNSYGASRFDLNDPFANTYETPGWQRAQKNSPGQEARPRVWRPAQLRPAHDRRRTGRQERHRWPVRLRGRRTHLPPEVRLRSDHVHRRQQTLDQLRKGRPEARPRFFCREALRDAPTIRSIGGCLPGIAVKRAPGRIKRRVQQLHAVAEANDNEILVRHQVNDLSTAADEVGETPLQRLTGTIENVVMHVKTVDTFAQERLVDVLTKEGSP